MGTLEDQARVLCLHIGAAGLSLLACSYPCFRVNSWRDAGGISGFRLEVTWSSKVARTCTMAFIAKSKGPKAIALYTFGGLVSTPRGSKYPIFEDSGLKMIPLTVFGTRVLEYWVLGPSGTNKVGSNHDVQPVANWLSSTVSMPIFQKDLQLLEPGKLGLSAELQGPRPRK